VYLLGIVVNADPNEHHSRATMLRFIHLATDVIAMMVSMMMLVAVLKILSQGMKNGYQMRQ